MSVLSKLKHARSRKAASQRLARLKKLAEPRRHADALQRRHVINHVARFWSDAFNLYDAVLLEARDLAATVAARKIGSVALRLTHQSLHGRGLLTASEIITLLRTGHGFGAYARWRTLFEVAAFAEFIKAHGEEAAQRFRDHYAIEARKYHLSRNPGLRETPMIGTPEAIGLRHKLDESREHLRAKYSDRFLEDLGWAEKWFPQKKRFTIQDIIEAVDLDHLKAEYRYASYYVHSGGRGSLDLYQWTDDGAVPLFVPGDDLISRPGRLSCVSLSLLTSVLVQACGGRGLDSRIWALGALSNEAEDAFVNGHRRWVEETGREDLAWRA